MTVLDFPLPNPNDPDDEPAVTFQGYYKGIVANPSGDGEIVLKIGVPNDQADEAWKVRGLVGYTLKFDVAIAPMDPWDDDTEPTAPDTPEDMPS